LVAFQEQGQEETVYIVGILATLKLKIPTFETQEFAQIIRAPVFAGAP
jgi:hypothetical protein